MKALIRIASSMAMVLGLGLSVQAGEKASKVASALKGKTIELKGGKIADGKVATDVDYYVLYHSASW